MKKLFISQAMNGLTNEEIETRRNEIIEAVKEDYGDIEVIDSFFKDAPHDAKPLWFLGESLKNYLKQILYSLMMDGIVLEDVR